MNENAQKWIDALRGGIYHQQKRNLRGIENGRVSYCCLGVANDLSKLGTWHHGDAGIFVYDGHDGKPREEGEFLTHSVKDWLGMKNVNGSLIMNGLKTSLHELNDDFDVSFDELAEIIETHAAQLFEIDV